MRHQFTHVSRFNYVKCVALLSLPDDVFILGVEILKQEHMVIQTQQPIYASASRYCCSKAKKCSNSQIYSLEHKKTFERAKVAKTLRTQEDFELSTSVISLGQILQRQESLLILPFKNDRLITLNVICIYMFQNGPNITSVF